MKAHQHAALFLHIAHSQTRTMTITPKWSENRCQNRLRFYFANVPKRIHQHTLLDGNLRIGFQVLHRAAAAAAGLQPKMLTGRLHTQGGLFFNTDRTSAFVTVFIAKTLIGHGLAGQRSFHEHHFAVAVRNTASVLIQRFDINRKFL